MSPRRSSDFRPNPDRALFLSDAIEQTTLDRLTPIILRLQGQSRDPITMYIDCYGGNIASAAVLHRIIKSTDQDGSPPCRLITVATGVAASAAADFLMAGDYALVYPHARILCHGVRQRSRADMLTHEKAIDLAKDLANSNEKYAIQLADNCIHRFIFRVAAAASEFPDIRERAGNPLLPHAECFIEALTNRISDKLIDVLRDALKRSLDNDALDMFTGKRLAGGPDVSSLPRAQFEVLVLKAILEYEAQQHASDALWSFRTYGLERIEDKLDLLLDKYDNHHAEMTSLLCARWGEMFLSKEQETEISKLAEGARPAQVKEATSDVMSTLWFFFVSICRLLQKDDYWMSAEEAYWLGLIDEVIGRTDLPSLRFFVEYPPANNDAISPAY
ncbi:MAG: ATP-dependent Clp protease proteolytic subunit [Terriglobia bacterium]|nr:ATP-dependent Clp protease proteolytic subunit [Terriglobia bacterium]